MSNKNTKNTKSKTNGKVVTNNIASSASYQNVWMTLNLLPIKYIRITVLMSYTLKTQSVLALFQIILWYFLSLHLGCS